MRRLRSQRAVLRQRGSPDFRGDPVVLAQARLDLLVYPSQYRLGRRAPAQGYEGAQMGTAKADSGVR